MSSRITLDTHVAIWVATSPKLLGKSATRALHSADRVFISAISFAELRIKQSAGMLQLPEDLDSQFQKAGFEIIDFDANAAAEISRFGSLVGHDPFDRMILANATAQNSVLMTADSKLLAQNLEFVVDAESELVCFSETV